MRKAKLTNGEMVPALGMGTWRMGERGGQRADELAALRRAIDDAGERSS